MFGVQLSSTATTHLCAAGVRHLCSVFSSGDQTSWFTDRHFVSGHSTLRLVHAVSESVARLRECHLLHTGGCLPSVSLTRNVIIVLIMANIRDVKVSRPLFWSRSRSHSNWSWSRPRSHEVLVSSLIRVGLVVSRRSFAFLIMIYATLVNTLTDTAVDQLCY